MTTDRGLQPLAGKIFVGLSRSYDRILLYATLFQDRYWKRWLLSEASISPGQHILDLGCGTGVLEESISCQDCSVVGLDVTEDMIRLAQEKRIPCLTSLSIADGEHLPFRERSFDLVLSCYVVKYCNYGALAAEVGRVLKPEGKLVLYDFSRPSGPFAIFHAFYVYGLMRIAGALLGSTDPGVAFTYAALPSVIRSRRWDDTFKADLAESGFSNIGKKKLTGGVVTAYWARKSA